MLIKLTYIFAINAMLIVSLRERPSEARKLQTPLFLRFCFSCIQLLYHVRTNSYRSSSGRSGGSLLADIQCSIYPASLESSSSSRKSAGRYVDNGFVSAAVTVVVVTAVDATSRTLLWRVAPTVNNKARWPSSTSRRIARSCDSTVLRTSSRCWQALSRSRTWAPVLSCRSDDGGATLTSMRGMGRLIVMCCLICSATRRPSLMK